jgi:3-deoxy-7-phosphoheptulonate synthase
VNWTPDTWRSFEAKQQPTWPVAADLERAEKHLSSYPPLVFAGEARDLKAKLAQVSEGKAFLLQAGDCAESFDGFNADAIRDKLRVILQMDWKE